MCDVADVVGGTLTGGIYPAVSALLSSGGSSGSGDKLNKKMVKDINTILSMEPTLLEAQRTYQPQYTQLGLENLYNELMGMGGTPGYLDIYAQNVVPAITGAETAANTARRTANVGDLAALGPGGLQALLGINPEQSALMQSLTRTATNQLNLGTRLDPEAVSNITSGVRSSWANRGLGTTAPAYLDEALQLYGGGQNLLAQREGVAGEVAGLNNAFYSQPLMQLLGFSSSNAPAAGQSLTATGASAGAAGDTGTMSTSDIESLFNMLFNAGSASGIASANNKAALWGAGISALGNLGGGALMAGFA